MVMKSYNFWDITPSGPLKFNQICITGPLQGQRQFSLSCLLWIHCSVSLYGNWRIILKSYWFALSCELSNGNCRIVLRFSHVFHSLRWLLSWVLFRPWRWRWYIPPKRQWTTGLYGFASQEVVLLMENSEFKYPCYSVSLAAGWWEHQRTMCRCFAEHGPLVLGDIRRICSDILLLFGDYPVVG